MADVSSNNGEISIPSYSRAGHVVIAIKATEGINYVNPYHSKQSDEAHDFGLTVVHYHFMKDQTTGNEFYDFRNQYTKHWRKGDYVALDAEQGQSIQSVQNFINLCENYGHEPMLYCDYNDYRDKYKVVRIKGHRYWIADYSSNPVVLNRPDVLWAKQYTDGALGPEPHYITGIGKSDCSTITFGVATALALRKLRTKRRR